MKDRTINERTFSTVDPEDGRRVVVKAQLSSLSGQRPRFSVTSGNGSDHERILRVFPELAPVVALHLSDDDGIPMHAVENLRYHLKNADLDAASRHAREPSRDKLEALAGRALFAEAENVKTAGPIEIRLKEEALAALDPIAEKATFFVRQLNHPLSETYSKRAEIKALARGLATGRKAEGAAERDFFPKLPRNLLEAIEKTKKALKGAPGAAMAEAKAANDPVRAYVEGRLAEWKAEADAAIAILKEEPVVADGYVAPENDRNTFLGFARFHGLKFDPGKSKPYEGSDFPKGFLEWECTLSNDRSTMVIPFRMHGDRGAPDIETVLDCLRSDVSGADQSFEDWCSDLGMDTDSRKALQSYEACRQERTEIEHLVGEAGLKHFVETVGEDSPVRPFEAEDEDEVPAPGM